MPREELVDRLRSRRVEIEQALLSRAAGVPGADRVGDVEYREGFRKTIPAAFDFCLLAIDVQEGEVPPIPASFLHQARLAARHRVGLDAVLRGYVAGSTLLDHFILEECDRDDIQTLLRLRAVALEHLLSHVSREYVSERRSRDTSRAARTLEHVQKLLQGEPFDTTDLNYPVTINHLGLVARGPGSRDLVRRLARASDSRLLLVGDDSEAVWAWLGRTGPMCAEEAQELICSERPEGVSVGIGESSSGISGWRHTHRQAKAAVRVAMGSATRVARYADVCLIASAMQDPLLTSSLGDIFLQPLSSGKDRGATHLQTLRAYFAADRNGVAAAATLGVSRQTINNRLRAIEARLGRPLQSVAAAIEVALQIHVLEQHGPARPGTFEPRK